MSHKAPLPLDGIHSVFEHIPEKQEGNHVELLQRVVRRRDTCAQGRGTILRGVNDNVSFTTVIVLV